MKKDYGKRFLFCTLALALYGLGNFLGVKAGAAGTNAWNTLSLGLVENFGLSFGNATLLVSAVIIGIDFLFKGKLGFGSVLNVLLIPFFSDLFLGLLAFVPEAEGMVMGTVLSLLGQVVCSFATILYMMPALGCGPRDTLMVIVGKKFPSLPIGAVKLGLELLVLLVGTLLGAPFGAGTVLILVLQAGIFQMACKVTQYEPRDIVHENFLDTIRNLR